MEGRESRARGAGSHDAARAAQSAVKGRQERRAEPPRHPAIPCLHPEEVSAPAPPRCRSAGHGSRDVATTRASVGESGPHGPRCHAAGKRQAGRPAGRSGAGVMLREPSQSRRTNSARFHPRELLKTGKFVEAERNGGFQGRGTGVPTSRRGVSGETCCSPRCRQATWHSALHPRKFVQRVDPC